MGGFNKDHVRAEPGKRLCHFASDWPRTDDPDPLGKLSQRKHGLVGQVLNPVEAGDRWGRCTRPRSDDRLAEPERATCDGDRVCAGEVPVVEKDIDAQVTEASRRIVLADACTQSAIRSIAAVKSVFHPSGTWTPNCPAPRTVAAMRAALMIPFDGTQP